MSQNLSTGVFQEKLSYKSSVKTILRTPDEDEHGFLKECNLENPSSVHEKTKYFPFLTHKKTSKVEDLDPSHELYSEDNKKVIGKMKLETLPELDLDEAVFLRSKSHSLNIKQNSSHCKDKGVQDHNKYTLEDYIFCLENSEN